MKTFEFRGEYIVSSDGIIIPCTVTKDVEGLEVFKGTYVTNLPNQKFISVWLQDIGIEDTGNLIRYLQSYAPKYLDCNSIHIIIDNSLDYQKRMVEMFNFTERIHLKLTSVYEKFCRY